MTDDTDEKIGSGKKGRKILVSICILALLVGSASGFYIVNNLIIFNQSDGNKNIENISDSSLTAPEYSDDVAFVPLESMTVSLGNDAQSRYLKFSANLEVPKSAKDDVIYLMPRVADALHSFLRALDETDIKNQESFLLLRSLMLHRVQLVLGEDRVTDILVSEFVLN